MSKYETKMTKTGSGWKAQTEVILGDVPATEYDPVGVRILHLTTSKNSRGDVSAFASTCIERKKDRGDGTFYTTQEHAVFGDYAKTISRVKMARVTEKAIREFHQAILDEYMDDVVEGAKTFYQRKEEAA